MVETLEMTRARTGAWVWCLAPGIRTCRACGAEAWRPHPFEPTVDVCGACWNGRIPALARLRGDAFVRTRKGGWRPVRKGERGVPFGAVWRAWLDELPTRPGL